jgi:hypothetical protein
MLRKKTKVKREGSTLKAAQLKKAKKLSVAKLKKDADKYFSQYIRLRDSNKFGVAECVTCGDKKPWKQLQNGHFVTRSCNLLRYDDLNCHAQCVACNMFKAGNLYEYGKQIDLRYGDGTADRLHAQRHTTHKLKIEELQKIITDAKEYILENNNQN